mmetsp:Transcript_64801/g.183913  ORF Transcript_64801/g.183913 Transcript_64801/m.183913 type:complete len:222 (+) Transcript_64801:100-765(+)
MSGARQGHELLGQRAARRLPAALGAPARPARGRLRRRGGRRGHRHHLGLLPRLPEVPRQRRAAGLPRNKDASRLPDPGGQHGQLPRRRQRQQHSGLPLLLRGRGEREPGLADQGRPAAVGAPGLRPRHWLLRGRAILWAWRRRASPGPVQPSDLRVEGRPAAAAARRRRGRHLPAAGPGHGQLPGEGRGPGFGHGALRQQAALARDAGQGAGPACRLAALH